MPDRGSAVASPPAGGGRRERLLREHFDTLAALYDPATCERIERLGIGPGWHCWEAGAGGGSVARWLAGQTGSTGRVLATDVDPNALAVSQGVGVEVLRHDLTADAAPEGLFDLVHARLLLEHIPDPQAGLAVLTGALRPGGWLLAESSDPMLAPLACPDQTGPAESLANKVRQAIWTLEGHLSLKRFGRTLPRLLRAAGLADVRAEVRFPLGGPDPVRLQRTLLERRGHRLVAAGLLTEDELARHRDDLAAGRLDVAAFAVVAAWGRQP